jgi:hypothetical protein
MPGYLDNYGVSETRRAKKIWRWVGATLASALLIFGVYAFWHDFREKRQVSRFIELLGARDYPAAYRLWGCDPAKPCRAYSMQKFLEDWGPQSPHANIAAAHVRRSRSCDQGVIQILVFPSGEEIPLYVDRAERQLAFSPFSYCMDAHGHNTKFVDIFFR